MPLLESLVKMEIRGVCSGRTKQHTAPPARDKENNRIRKCCLTSHTWPPAMKQKSYSYEILIQAIRFFSIAETCGGEKEPSSALQNTMPLKRRRKEKQKVQLAM
jgi:hypothetical protein